MAPRTNFHFCPEEDQSIWFLTLLLHTGNTSTVDFMSKPAEKLSLHVHTRTHLHDSLRWLNWERWGGGEEDARGVMVKCAWQKVALKHRHTVPKCPTTPNTLWWTPLELALNLEQLSREHIRMGTAPLRPPYSHSQHSSPLLTALHAQCSVQTLTLQYTIGPAESGVACRDICR